MQQEIESVKTAAGKKKVVPTPGIRGFMSA
jgi:hypothetical protein